MKNSFLRSKTFYRIFIRLLIVSLVVSVLAIMLYERNTRTTLKEKILLEESNTLDTVTQVIGKDLENIVTDVEFMMKESIHHELNQNIENDKFISKLWMNFMDAKKYYDQIRFIDSNGFETIRVNWDDEEGASVRSELLQNKSNRYYFQESIVLNHGELYVSKVDLNIENGVIEIPIKPVIRIGIRIKTDKLNGVLLFNFAANSIAQDLSQFNQSTKGHLYLLNADGDYLYHADDAKIFRFMFDDKNNGNFEVDYPGVLAKHIDKDYVVENNELFIVSELSSNDMININDKTLFGSEKMYIVNHVKESDLGSTFDNETLSIFSHVVRNNVYIFFFIFVGIFIVSYLQYRISKSKKLVQELFEKDALTNTYNRRAGMSIFTNMLQDASYENVEVSVIFLDVDGLKQINDNLGHEYGDLLLKSIVEVIQDVIRDDDLLMRLGGDEFLIVLNRIGLTGSEHVMERIVDKLLTINGTDKYPFFMSISYGITSTIDAKTNKLETLMHISDEKMYKNKHSKDRSRMLKEDK